MKGARTHFLSAMVGGVIVAGAFVAFGVSRTQRTETIVEEAPVAAQPAASSDPGLTAHAIYQREAPGVVYVRARLVAPTHSPFDVLGADGDLSTGSGFLVDRQGDILTAYHVIDGADRAEGVTVQFNDNVVREASVAAVDPGDDLAVLHVGMRGVDSIAPLPLGDSTSVRVGDPMLAIGNPAGLDRTLVSGIVSALQHEVEASDGRVIDNVIQTDQPIDPADAGGPLLDAEGRVVGVDSQVATADGPGQIIAFAVPIDTADPLLARVEHGGPVPIAYLGVTGGPVPGRTSGAVIDSVVRGGPAALAGLRQGERITRVDGVAIETMTEVLSIVRTRSPGQSLSVEVRDGRAAHTVTVVLGSRTDPGSHG